MCWHEYNVWVVPAMTRATSRRRGRARCGGTTSTTRSTSCATSCPSPPPPGSASPSSSSWPSYSSMSEKQTTSRNVSCRLKHLIRLCSSISIFSNLISTLYFFLLNLLNIGSSKLERGWLSYRQLKKILMANWHELFGLCLFVHLLKCEEEKFKIFM